MDIAIRAAVSQDYDQVERIMKQVHTLHVGWRPDVYRQVDTVMPEGFFLELVSRGAILAAILDGQIVGLAAFQERQVSGGPILPRKVLFIDDLAVLGGYRGMGIGTRLLDQVKEQARERGCDSVDLQVNARNEQALQMYHHYGFSERSINLELPLCDEEE